MSAECSFASTHFSHFSGNVASKRDEFLLRFCFLKKSNKKLKKEILGFQFKFRKRKEKPFYAYAMQMPSHILEA